MQEETLTFEEIELLKARRNSWHYVPAEVVEAYFTMKAFLHEETHETAKI